MLQFCFAFCPFYVTPVVQCCCFCGGGGGYGRCKDLIFNFSCVSSPPRIIDVSPSAFRKHPQLFEAMKSSEDGTYKVTEHFAV